MPEVALKRAEGAGASLGPLRRFVSALLPGQELPHGPSSSGWAKGGEMNGRPGQHFLRCHVQGRRDWEILLTKASHGAVAQLAVGVPARVLSKAPDVVGKSPDPVAPMM